MKGQFRIVLNNKKAVFHFIQPLQLVDNKKDKRLEK